MSHLTQRYFLSHVTWANRLIAPAARSGVDLGRAAALYCPKVRTSFRSLEFCQPVGLQRDQTETFTLWRASIKSRNLTLVLVHPIFPTRSQILRWKIRWKIWQGRLKTPSTYNSQVQDSLMHRNSRLHRTSAGRVMIACILMVTSTIVRLSIWRCCLRALVSWIILKTTLNSRSWTRSWLSQISLRWLIKAFLNFMECLMGRAAELRHHKCTQRMDKIISETWWWCSRCSKSSSSSRHLCSTRRRLNQSLRPVKNRPNQDKPRALLSRS